MDIVGVAGGAGGEQLFGSMCPLCRSWPLQGRRHLPARAGQRRVAVIGGAWPQMATRMSGVPREALPQTARGRCGAGSWTIGGPIWGRSGVDLRGRTPQKHPAHQAKPCFEALQETGLQAPELLFCMPEADSAVRRARSWARFMVESSTLDVRVVEDMPSLQEPRRRMRARTRRAAEGARSQAGARWCGGQSRAGSRGRAARIGRRWAGASAHRRAACGCARAGGGGQRAGAGARAHGRAAGGGRMRAHGRGKGPCTWPHLLWLERVERQGGCGCGAIRHRECCTAGR